MRTQHDYLLSTRNKDAVARNGWQGTDKKVLFVCSAGVLRSPTAARRFCQAPYNWNTRAAGSTETYALIPVSQQLLDWAEQIYLMEEDNLIDLENLYGDLLDESYRRKIHVLNIPDNFEHMDSGLIYILEEKVNDHLLSLRSSTE